MFPFGTSPETRRETMKRTLVFAAAALTALAAAGLAVAWGVDGNKTAKAVAGTFSATTASKVQTRTCTTADGKTLVASNGTYTGTSSGDPDLTGNLTIEARSVINTTDNVGVVTGHLRIDVPGRNTQAHFDSVYSGGTVAGLANGYAHDPAAALLANLSAGFSASGGFSGGKLGGGTAGGAAVEVGPGRCQPTKVVNEKSEARGTVSAVSSSSITVAGLTCTVPPNLQPKVATVKVNDRAEIHCQLVGNVNTLTRLDVKH
jgi:hypothetical protein